MRKASLDMVHDLAKKDSRVVFVGSDLGAGVLDAMKDEMPDRYFMEGVLEQGMIGMAAGLAMEGFVPYLNTIATFMTRRCFEQVVVDLALHRLPVRLISSGGGLVYAPLGPTHLAVEDIAIMRAVPNMTVFCASDAVEMRRFMSKSVDWPGPIYIRLGKGGDPVIADQDSDFEIGTGIWYRREGEVCLISTGVMTARCLETADILSQQGVSCSVLHLHTVKPLDSASVRAAAGASKLMVTVEEGVLAGGLGSAVLECLADSALTCGVLRLGIPDVFAKNYGTQDELLESYGLQPRQIAESVLRRLGRYA